MALKQKNIVNNTHSYEKKDYEAAIGNYLESIKKITAVKAVYQIGDIKAPGISDIDLIVVVSRDLDKVERKYLSINLLSKKERYLFLHDPIVIKEREMNDLHYLLPVFKLRWRKGKKINISVPIKEIKSELCLIHLLDIIILYYPRECISLLVGRKEIGQREALCRLNLLTYNMQLVSRMTNKEKKGNKFGHFVKRIQNLRRNWFNLNVSEREEKLKRVIKVANVLVYDLIETLQAHLKKEGIVAIKHIKMEEYSLFTNNHTIIFKRDWDKEKAWKEAINIYKETGMICSILPIEYACVMMNMPLGEVMGQPLFHLFKNSVIKHQFTVTHKKKCNVVLRQFKEAKINGGLCNCIGTAMVRMLTDSSIKGKVKIFCKKTMYMLYKYGLLW
jgi:hypothetical protein